MGPRRLPAGSGQWRPFVACVCREDARRDEGRIARLPARTLSRGRGGRGAGRQQAVHDAVALRAGRFGPQHPAARARIRAGAQRDDGRKGRGPVTRRARVRDGEGIPRAAGSQELHAAGARGGAAAVPLQHAPPVRRPAGSRRLEPLADGPDRIGQLHPVHRRHPADALRLEHPDEVRSGGDGLRAGRCARRRQRGSRSHPDGGIRAGSRLRRQD